MHHTAHNRRQTEANGTNPGSPGRSIDLSCPCCLANGRFTTLRQQPTDYSKTPMDGFRSAPTNNPERERIARGQTWRSCRWRRQLQPASSPAPAHPPKDLANRHGFPCGSATCFSIVGQETSKFCRRSEGVQLRVVPTIRAMIASGPGPI